jgi:hypothetical protein
MVGPHRLVLPVLVQIYAEVQYPDDKQCVSQGQKMELLPRQSE